METVYLRNRYYNPKLGRFSAVDPAKYGLNWYTYCGNNPLRFVDPLGLYREKLDETPEENLEFLGKGRKSKERLRVNLNQNWLSFNTTEKTESLALSMDSIQVGGRIYSAQSGILNHKDVELIRELSNESGIDYYLILAIILHESGAQANKENPYSGAAGLMQIMPNNWAAYTVVGEQYYKRYENLRKIAEKYDADFNNMFNSAANITVGVSILLEWGNILQTNDIQSIIGGYGEGKNSAATYEILYYRDYMANAAGEATWYVNKLYTLSGDRI